MKKNYENPIIEIISLNEEDIVTTSGLLFFESGDGELKDYSNLFNLNA